MYFLAWTCSGPSGFQSFGQRPNSGASVVGHPGGISASTEVLGIY